MFLGAPVSPVVASIFNAHLFALLLPHVSVPPDTFPPDS